MQGNGSTAPRCDWPLALLASLSLVGFPLVSIFPVALGLESRPISVAFRPVINDYRGRRSVELHLADWRVDVAASNGAPVAS